MVLIHPGTHTFCQSQTYILYNLDSKNRSTDEPAMRMADSDREFEAEDVCTYSTTCFPMYRKSLQTFKAHPLRSYKHSNVCCVHKSRHEALLKSTPRTTKNSLMTQKQHYLAQPLTVLRQALWKQLVGREFRPACVIIPNSRITTISCFSPLVDLLTAIPLQLGILQLQTCY